MSAYRGRSVEMPPEPMRPAGSDPDDPLTVLVRAHYPRITYNVVASAGRPTDGHGHLWYVSGSSGSCIWEQLLDGVLVGIRTSPVLVEVYRLWPEGWPLDAAGGGS